MGLSCTLIATIIHNSPDTGLINIQSHSTQLMHERITIHSEWTVLLSQIYCQLLQNVIVHVVPDPEMTTVNTGNRIYTSANPALWHMLQ